MGRGAGVRGGGGERVHNSELNLIIFHFFIIYLKEWVLASALGYVAKKKKMFNSLTITSQLTL